MAAAPLLYFRNLLANHPRQRDFLEATEKYRQVFFFGGNQSGKTTVGLARAVACSLGYRYWEVPKIGLTTSGDMPPREEIPRKFWVTRWDGVPIRVPNLGVVTTGLKRTIGIGENIYPRLHEFVPEAWRTQKLAFKAAKGALGVPENVTFPNGSRWVFLSEEMEDWVFEGFVADWWWDDEPNRHAIFNAMQARLLANSGRSFFTLTPLGTRSAWMLQYLRDPPTDTFCLTVTQADNPGLTAEQKQKFAENSQWTDREKAARLRGEFEVLGDRVFEEWEPAAHVVLPRQIRPDEIRGMTADPHHRKPAFLLWWTYDPATRSYHFYREWPHDRDFFKATSGGLSPTEYGTLIRNAEGRFPSRHRVCDPRFGKSEHTLHGFKSTCWVDQMGDLGLHFDANVPNCGTIEFGHQVIAEMLHYDKAFPLSPTNMPRITVSADCKNLIRAFEMYGFTDVKDPVKGLFKKVSEEYKDPIDCVRYTVLWPIPATREQIERLQRVTPQQLEAENDY